jgi:hypothetical protein
MGSLLGWLLLGGHRALEGVAWVFRNLKWWMWIAVFFIGLVFLCLNQRGQIKEKNAALVLASYELSSAAQAIRSRDKLIYSITQTGGQQWTKEEERCREQARAAYDAGATVGVRNNRERQTSGAFAGSVPE